MTSETGREIVPCIVLKSNSRNGNLTASGSDERNIEDEGLISIKKLATLFAGAVSLTLEHARV
jgi:hypothetical protein